MTKQHSLRNVKSPHEKQAFKNKAHIQSAQFCHVQVIPFIQVKSTLWFYYCLYQQLFTSYYTRNVKYWKKTRMNGTTLSNIASRCNFIVMIKPQIQITSICWRVVSKQMSDQPASRSSSHHLHRGHFHVCQKLRAVTPMRSEHHSERKQRAQLSRSISTELQANISAAKATRSFQARRTYFLAFKSGE